MILKVTKNWWMCWCSLHWSLVGGSRWNWVIFKDPSSKTIPQFHGSICHHEEPNGQARKQPCSCALSGALQQQHCSISFCPLSLTGETRSSAQTSACHCRSTSTFREKVNSIRSVDAFSVGLLFHLYISNRLWNPLYVPNNASPLMFGRDYSHKRESFCQNNENKKVFKIKMSGR